MTHGSRGITLIELIVVMAILSVLLAFVGPSASAGIDNLVLTSDGRRVASAFRSAQTMARTTGQRVFATYDESGLRFLKANQPYQTLTMRRGVRLISSDKSAAIIFLESGQIVGPDTVDLINSRGRRVQLSIDHATGSIKSVNGG